MLKLLRTQLKKFFVTQDHAGKNELRKNVLLMHFFRLFYGISDFVYFRLLLVPDLKEKEMLLYK